MKRLRILLLAAVLALAPLTQTTTVSADPADPGIWGPSYFDPGIFDPADPGIF